MEIKSSKELVPLPAELTFDQDNELFTIQKCPYGVIDNSAGDDPECMLIPFDKTIQVAIVYDLIANPLTECKTSLLT